MPASPIEQHLARAERRSVETLLLRPTRVADRFARARGLWKDAPVSLTTRAYEGDAAAYVRVAHVTGVNLSLGSLLAIPRPNRALPLFSVDLARLALNGETLVVADATPMIPEGPCPSGTTADRSWLAPSPRRPSWCDDFCSSGAIHSRVSPARLGDALAIVDQLADAWMTTVSGAEPSPDRADAVRARQHAYTTARRADTEWLSLLGSMFGRAWACEYVEQVLFPVI